MNLIRYSYDALLSKYKELQENIIKSMPPKPKPKQIPIISEPQQPHNIPPAIDDKTQNPDNLIKSVRVKIEDDAQSIK